MAKLTMQMVKRKRKECKREKGRVGKRRRSGWEERQREEGERSRGRE